MASNVMKDVTGMQTVPTFALKMCWWLEKQISDEMTWIYTQDGQFIRKFNLTEGL